MLCYITLYVCLPCSLGASPWQGLCVSVLPVPGTIPRYRQCSIYACVVSEPINSFLNESGQEERREGNGD